VAEGGGLLNRYRVKSSIGGSNPPLSARKPHNSLKINNMLSDQQLIVVGNPDKSVHIVHGLNCLQPLNPKNLTIQQR
jgi:hypothetical protein